MYATGLLENAAVIVAVGAFVVVVLTVIGYCLLTVIGYCLLVAVWAALWFLVGVFKAVRFLAAPVSRKLHGAAKSVDEVWGD